MLCMSTLRSGSSGMSSILSSAELEQFESWLDDNGVDKALLENTVGDAAMTLQLQTLTKST